MVFKTPSSKVVRKRTGGKEGSHGRRVTFESHCHNTVQSRIAEKPTWARRCFFFSRIDSQENPQTPQVTPEILYHISNI